LLSIIIIASSFQSGATIGTRIQCLILRYWCRANTQISWWVSTHPELWTSQLLSIGKKMNYL